MDATRRWILSRSGAVALAGSLAGCATGPREAAKPGLGNTLVLVELNGGNAGRGRGGQHADEHRRHHS